MLNWSSELTGMALLIGTDEAGYGPNLGPLTICATSWEVPEIDVDLYRLLAEFVSPKPGAVDKITICDSKSIYSPSSRKSLTNLETYVLAMLYSLHGNVPTDASELDVLISGDQHGSLSRNSLWNLSLLKLPLVAELDSVVSLGSRFRSVCETTDTSLKQVRCHAIFPEEFNCSIERLGNKAELLSSETLTCVKQILEPSTSHLETHIVCDKHGGRSKYSALLNQCLTEQFVRVVGESRELSEYCWFEGDRKFQIHFKSKGESFLPTALASMIAKYFREVCMEVWNQFWLAKVPGIKPTKGYPLDAKRFKKEIAKTQVELGISDFSIWRNK